MQATLALLVAIASFLVLALSRIVSVSDGAKLRETKVERLAAPPKRDVFVVKLSYAPFLIAKGGLDGWEAPLLWDDAYLAKTAGDAVFSIEVSESGEFGDLAAGWHFRNMTLREFVQVYQTARPRVYLNGLVPKALHADVLIPPFVPCLSDSPPPFERIVNVWFGRGGEVSLLHNDLQDNLLHMVRGSKTVILFAPNQTQYLYERRDIARTETRVSPVDPTAPDYKTHPLFAQAQRREVTVAQGQVLFIPALWWHHVTSHGPSIAVNIWWDALDYARDGLEHVYATPSDVLANELATHAPLCRRDI
jgi:hypothetical protein